MISPAMTPFGQLMQVFAASRKLEDPLIRRSVDDLLGAIRRERELRFFVDGTPNCGHQAATIHIMKRIISMTGFAGRVTIVYADIHQGTLGRTPDKLALLFTGLVPARIDTSILEYETCKDIRFLDYDNRDSLAGHVQFGFTGGADDMTINFAADLKVNYFLRIQPYLWDDDSSKKQDRFYQSSRLETPAGRFFYPVDDYPPFRNLPCKFSKTVCAVSEATWNWYARDQNFDPQLKRRTNNARTLYQAQQQAGLRIWPVYGLHQFREHAAEMAMNLALTGLQVQRETPGPVAVLVLMPPSEIPEFLQLLAPFARDLAEANNDLQSFSAALTARYEDQLRAEGAFSREHLDVFVAQIANQIQPCVRAKASVTLLSGYDTQTASYLDISGMLSEAVNGAGPNSLIVALIGPVPGEIYNYFYSTSSMPGVFEGQHTSSLAISMGRPFLQIPREVTGIRNPYPATVASDDFSTIASTANAAASQLRDQQYEAYLRRTNAAEPREYMAQLRKTAEFILQAQDPESSIYRYFQALGDYFQEDIHDKLFAGLMAQVLST
ncbi:MAG TPA: hypothetical protein VG675_02770 [Bryobacteraceae bacterium]|nr:hypothetical protein [Bryobacteraceae bacterium]